MAFSPKPEVLTRAIDDFRKRQGGLPEDRELSLLNLSRFLLPEDSDVLQEEILKSFDWPEEPELAISVVKHVPYLNTNALKHVRVSLPKIMTDHLDEVVDVLRGLSESDIASIWTKDCWWSLVRGTDDLSVAAELAGEFAAHLNPVNRQSAWGGVTFYLAEEEPNLARQVADSVGGPSNDSEIVDVIRAIVDGPIKSEQWEEWAAVLGRQLGRPHAQAIDIELASSFMKRLVEAVDSGAATAGGADRLGGCLIELHPAIDNEALAELEWGGHPWWSTPGGLESRRNVLSLETKFLNAWDELRPCLPYEARAIEQALASANPLSDGAQDLLVFMIEEMTHWALSRNWPINPQWIDQRTEECLRRLSGPRGVRATTNLHQYIRRRDPGHKLPAEVLELMLSEQGEDVEKALAAWVTHFRPQPRELVQQLRRAHVRTGASREVREAFQQYVSIRNRQRATDVISLILTEGTDDDAVLLRGIDPSKLNQTKIAEVLARILADAGNKAERQSALRRVQETPLVSPGPLRTVIDAVFKLAEESAAAATDVIGNFPKSLRDAPGVAARFRRLSSRRRFRGLRSRIENALSTFLDGEADS